MQSAHESRKRRQLGRRDSEEKRDRQIRTHFAHFSQQQLATVRIDGMLVRERLERDLQQMPKRPGGRVGTSYWKDLVAQYSAGIGQFGSIKPANAEQAVSRELCPVT